MSQQSDYQPSAPAPQGPAPYYGPPVPGQYHSSPAPSPSKGLAIASLVLGVIAILGCLIPGVNFVSIALGLVGGVLGIISLVKRLGGRGMAIAGVVLSILAIVVSMVVNLIFGAALTSVSEGLASASPMQPSVDASDVASPEAETSVPSDAQAAEVLQPGQAGAAGDYKVTVTGINTNANSLVKEANQFNSEPVGQYVVVDVSVSYEGSEKGTPWIDLNWTFQGADHRDYKEASCSLENGVMDQPDLRQGGSSSYAICFDVPAAAISGATVSAEETLSFDDQGVAWAVK